MFSREIVRIGMYLDLYQLAKICLIVCMPSYTSKVLSKSYLNVFQIQFTDDLWVWISPTTHLSRAQNVHNRNFSDSLPHPVDKSSTI